MEYGNHTYSFQNHSAVSKWTQIIKYYLQKAPVVQRQDYEMEDSEILALRVATATNISPLYSFHTSSGLLMDLPCLL
jgi:hypothetical protein